MAPRPPFAGKLPSFSSTVGDTSPAVAAGNVNRALSDAQRQAVKGGEHSDVNAKGESVRGNSNEQTVNATFKKANTALFIPHNFGYTVRNWSLVRKNKFGDVAEVPGKPFTKNGIWLMSSVDDLKVRIRLDGQEGNK